MLLNHVLKPVLITQQRSNDKITLLQKIHNTELIRFLYVRQQEIRETIDTLCLC